MKLLYKGSSKPTLEGAGVKLHRAFGFHDTDITDPFLLLDDFRGDKEEDFIAGFPWHPHRGIETITYLIEGSVEHGDSMGTGGIISSGDVQWMTAGSGIVHQEMPKPGPRGRMGGFQLWANLPAKEKMTDPKYRGVTAKDIPVVKNKGVEIKVICGQVDKVKGPVHDITIQPEYIDVSISEGAEFTRDFNKGRKVIAYIYEGSGNICGESVKNRDVVIFEAGKEFEARAEKSGIKFLLISGMPLKEPVAWYGPIVMNTRQELETAFREYEDGTFLKHAKKG